MKGWVQDDAPDSGAAANITTTQLEKLQALKTKNERLKTDLGTLDVTSERSTNYTRSQILRNSTPSTLTPTPTPTPTKEQRQKEIQTQMNQLEALFFSP